MVKGSFIFKPRVNAFGTFNAMRKADKWKVLRFFLIPFCVSSYPQLIQGNNFLLILSPVIWENLLALLGIILFLGIMFLAKRNTDKKVQ